MLCRGNIACQSSLSDALTEICDGCLNKNTCRIITHLKSNVTTSHCACVQGWLGERCQTRVRLLLVTITMTTATLKWEAVPADSKDTFAEIINVSDINNHNILSSAHTISDRHLEHSQYDLSHNNGTVLHEAQSFVKQTDIHLNYWTSSRMHVCNVVPNLTKAEFIISGLEAGTEYTFCANTDQSHTCDFGLVSNRRLGILQTAPACVSVTTQSDDNSIPHAYVIIVLCIAVIGLAVLIVIAVKAKRNNYFSLLICETKNRRKHTSLLQNSPKLMTSPGDSHPDIYLLKSRSANQTISIFPPKWPGKPKHQMIHKRLRGYAAFTAINEQTIPLSTVLEYHDHEDSDDESDDSDDTDAEEDVTTEMDLELNLHQLNELDYNMTEN